MTESDWLAGTHPAELLRAVRDRVSHRKLRLLAVACCRRHEDLIQAKRSAPLRRRLELAEAIADGTMRIEEFGSDYPLGGRGDRAITSLSTIRRAVYALGWPEAGRPNWDLDEATGEFTPRPWQPGEYAEHFTIRVLFFAAHSASRPRPDVLQAAMDCESAAQADLVRCIIPSPFRPVAFDPDWQTAAAVALARTLYESRDFATAPVLADALEDAGCADPAVLDHLRGPGPHARGCWVVDEVLGLA